jgi:hypothetical protein
MSQFYTAILVTPTCLCSEASFACVHIYNRAKGEHNLSGFFFFFLFFVSLDFILRNYIQLLINRDMLFSPLLFLHVLRNHTLGYIINRLQTQNFTQYIYIYIYMLTLCFSSSCSSSSDPPIHLESVPSTQRIKPLHSASHDPMEYVSHLPLQRVQSLLKREDSRFTIATEKLLLL